MLNHLRYSFLIFQKLIDLNMNKFSSHVRTRNILAYCQFELFLLICGISIINGFETFSHHGYEESSLNKECSLNGAYDSAESKCICDQGWKGDTCAFLSLDPAPTPQNPKRGRAPGVSIPGVPTWGGGAQFEDDRWHLLVGSRAIQVKNNSLGGYPCNSKIIRVVSEGSDPLGPYKLAETVFQRSSWEPGLAKNSVTGELVVMFFGNITNLPPIDSPTCVEAQEFSDDYNLTSMNTFISVSKSGSMKGPKREFRN